jgi:hypothetical protein
MNDTGASPHDDSGLSHIRRTTKPPRRAIVPAGEAKTPDRRLRYQSRLDSFVNIRRRLRQENDARSG